MDILRWLVYLSVDKHLPFSIFKSFCVHRCTMSPWLPRLWGFISLVTLMKSRIRLIEVGRPTQCGWHLSLGWDPNTCRRESSWAQAFVSLLPDWCDMTAASAACHMTLYPVDCTLKLLATASPSSLKWLLSVYFTIATGKVTKTPGLEGVWLQCVSANPRATWNLNREVGWEEGGGFSLIFFPLCVAVLAGLREPSCLRCCLFLLSVASTQCPARLWPGSGCFPCGCGMWCCGRNLCFILH